MSKVITIGIGALRECVEGESLLKPDALKAHRISAQAFGLGLIATPDYLALKGRHTSPPKKLV